MTVSPPAPPVPPPPAPSRSRSSARSLLGRSSVRPTAPRYARQLHHGEAPAVGIYVSSSTFLLSPPMTLLAPRPDRTLTPHTFVVPVVRELPLLDPTRLPASPLLLRLVATPQTASAHRPPESSSPRAAGSVNAVPYEIMGVVNVTPDSFSDGGQFDDAAQAIAHGRRLAAEGAAILDVGGESTRPGAEPVPASSEELRARRARRRGPARRRAGLDRHDEARVAEAAVDAGATYVNDVTAFRHDPDLAGLVADRGLDCCLMHMLGEPRTMQADPRYDDVVSEVKAFLERADGVRGRAPACPRSGSSSTPGSASARRSSTTSSCCARLDELTDARPPAGDRHLAQVVHRAAHRPRRDRARARRPSPPA